jgi:hypothetical protein
MVSQRSTRDTTWCFWRCGGLKTEGLKCGRRGRIGWPQTRRVRVRWRKASQNALRTIWNWRDSCFKTGFFSLSCIKNNDAALIFFGQFKSEKVVPVCRALPDPDHCIKFCMIFSNMSKVGVKNTCGSCWEQHTHWDDRISLLETVVFFAKLFAQVAKIQGLF